MFLLLILLSATFSTGAAAQSLKTLRGRITDANGTAVIGAKARLENAGRSFSAETATDNRGNFQFSNLPPGNYKLSVRQNGFAETTKEIEINSGFLAEIEISLAVISASDDVAKLPAAADDEPIITDRPDFTESPDVVPRRFKAQIESGLTFARVGNVKETAIGEILVRVPVAERVELRFGVPSYIFDRPANGDADDRATGFEDAFFGAKIALVKGAGEPGLLKKPGVALLVGTSLPTGARTFRESSLQPEAALSVGTVLTERFSLASNIGYVRARQDGIGFNQFFGSLSLGAALTKRVGLYLEIYGFTRVEAETRCSARFANGGLTYLVNKNFQLDARLGVGLGNHTAGPDYFFGFGFAKRF
ncbi:MAG: transporter [Pyrinomonadaceae bacterium]